MADSEIELDAETDNDKPKNEKQKVLQKYLPGYQIKYPVMRWSSVSDNHAYYTVCRCDFCVSLWRLAFMDRCFSFSKVGSCVVVVHDRQVVQTVRQTDTRLTASSPGQIGQAGTSLDKPAPERLNQSGF